MRDFRDAKLMAKVLKQAFGDRNTALTHSEALEIVAAQFGDEAGRLRRVVAGNRVDGDMDGVFPGGQPTVRPPRAKADGGEDEQQDQDAEFAEHGFEGLAAGSGILRKAPSAGYNVRLKFTKQ